MRIDGIGGLGSPLEFRHGNLRIVHMGGIGAAAAKGAAAVQEATGTAAQVAFLRAWKKHPPGFSADEIVGLLAMAAAYGHKVQSARPFQVFHDYDTASLPRAIEAIEGPGGTGGEAQKWRSLRPWPWQETGYYPKNDPAVQTAYKKMLAVYQEAAGITGASATVRAAQKELVKDLTNPDRWAWWQKIKPFAIVGGIILGAAVAYPYVKPLLKRAG